MLRIDPEGYEVIIVGAMIVELWTDSIGEVLPSPEIIPKQLEESMM